MFPAAWYPIIQTEHTLSNM